MDNYFAPHPSDEESGAGGHVAPQDPQRLHQFQNQDSSAAHHGDSIPSSEPPITMADTLGTLISAGSDEIQRRHSAAHLFGGLPSAGSGQSEPMSVMDFGNPDDALGTYQFSNTGLHVSNSFHPSLHQGSEFSDPNLLAISPTANFTPISPDVMGGNTMAFSNLNFSTIAPEHGGTMNLYANQFQAPPPAAPLSASTFNPTGTAQPATLQESQVPQLHQPQPRHQLPQAPQQSPQLQRSHGLSHPSTQNPQQPLPPRPPQSAATGPDTSTTRPSISQSVSLESSPGPSRPTPSLSAPSAAVKAGGVETCPAPAASGADSKAIYSKSGFDMLRAFWYVGTRKNPIINLGAVDMSCSFVVCDVTMNDCPIIYVSDNFQNLTGYNRHEIVGKNCRFLQAPDGKVDAGSKRQYVDNGAVLNLKHKIAAGEEVQQSLINYRKGGKPFLNLLTMIPIPWDTDEIRYIIGFQIDLVECPEAIAARPTGADGFQVDYKHSDIGQYVWTPPTNHGWEEKTLSVDDVSTLLKQFNPKGTTSDWHKQSWDKMLLENADDVVHVLSLKGLFLYLSPSCKKVLEYETKELVGNSLSSVCHPSDIVPVTRELKDTAVGSPANIVFRIRRKESGYTWFESHGSLFIEQGKGRKCIVLVGRKRPVYALCRRDLDAYGGIGDSELWSKLSASGMLLFVSSNSRSLLDIQPENLVGTSIQDLMRKDSRPDFGRAVEKARCGKTASCRHEILNRRGQMLQAQTFLYPGDAIEGHRPTFLLAQTKLVKALSRSIAVPAGSVKAVTVASGKAPEDPANVIVSTPVDNPADEPPVSEAGANTKLLSFGDQDAQLASEDNIFDELKTTRCTSWQYELRQMEKMNRSLAEELAGLLSSKKKRKRRKGSGNAVRDCANCHTRSTPEWRRGPSGNRDLCNSCGLRWAKQPNSSLPLAPPTQTGRVSPRASTRGDAQSRVSNSPVHSSPMQYTGQGAADTPEQMGEFDETGSRTAPSPSAQVLLDTGNSGDPMPSITEETFSGI